MDWAYMLKLGTNMWCDVVPPKWAHYTADELHYTVFVLLRTACDNSDKRIDEVIGKRAYDASESSTDDNTDSHVHNVAFECEFFEFL
jgi:hypothetical protein